MRSRNQVIIQSDSEVFYLRKVERRRGGVAMKFRSILCAADGRQGGRCVDIGCGWKIVEKLEGCQNGESRPAGGEGREPGSFFVLVRLAEPIWTRSLKVRIVGLKGRQR
jgi:hypothetical protein